MKTSKTHSSFAFGLWGLIVKLMLGLLFISEIFAIETKNYFVRINKYVSTFFVKNRIKEIYSKIFLNLFLKCKYSG